MMRTYAIPKKESEFSSRMVDSIASEPLQCAQKKTDTNIVYDRKCWEVVL